MRTFVVCAVVLWGCQSAEQKAAKRVEAARVDAALRRAQFPLVRTAARDLPKDRAELVLRVTPLGLELEDLVLEGDGGTVGPVTLDAFKEPRTDGWVELPLLARALRERSSYPRLALDVAPQTPSFRVAQVVAWLDKAEASVTLAGPTGLIGLPLDTRGVDSEACAHDGVVASGTSCIVPRVTFSSAGVQVATIAGDERCFARRLSEPEEHTWNPAPLLAADGGCFADAPAPLVVEAIALAPGCRHVVVEFGEPMPTWSTVAEALAAIAAAAPGREFALVGSLEVAPLDCTTATRPAQWQRFVRAPPRKRLEWKIDDAALRKALAPLGLFSNDAGR